MSRKRDFFHTGLDVSRSECQLARLNNLAVFGNTYVVDKTNGKDSNDGNIYSPFETIQRAITVQIAENSGLGDRIWVMPGTYPESLTGNLTGVQLLGGMPSNPEAVIVKPTVGSSYVGELRNAVVDGMTFWSSSGTNTAYAGFRAEQMNGSIVNNCHFFPGAVNALSTAFRLGEEVSTASWQIMSRSQFTNNHIGVNQGTAFYYGMCFGVSAPTDANNKKVLVDNSLIVGNNVCGELYGIMLGILYTWGAGTIIKKNDVQGGGLYAGECHKNGIRAYDRGHDNKLIKVYDNRISSHDAPIVGIQDGATMGNIISTANATPTQEYPA